MAFIIFPPDSYVISLLHNFSPAGTNLLQTQLLFLDRNLPL